MGEVFYDCEIKIKVKNVEDLVELKKLDFESYDLDEKNICERIDENIKNNYGEIFINLECEETVFYDLLDELSFSIESDCIILASATNYEDYETEQQILGLIINGIFEDYELSGRIYRGSVDNEVKFIRFIEDRFDLHMYKKALEEYNLFLRKEVTNMDIDYTKYVINKEGLHNKIINTKGKISRGCFVFEDENEYNEFIEYFNEDYEEADIILFETNKKLKQVYFIINERFEVWDWITYDSDYKTLCLGDSLKILHTDEEKREYIDPSLKSKDTILTAENYNWLICEEEDFECIRYDISETVNDKTLFINLDNGMTKTLDNFLKLNVTEFDKFIDTYYSEDNRRVNNKISSILSRMK